MTFTVEERNQIIALMAQIYYDEPSARAVLLGIGFPAARIPAFHSAEAFWPPVMLMLESGIVRDGFRLLLRAVAEAYPGNAMAAALLTGFDPAPPGAPPVEESHEVRARVLALFADPARSSKIRIDRESRLLEDIRDKGGIEIEIRHAVRVTDIIAAILRSRPTILHFGGHGGQNGRLYFEGTTGSVTPVSARALADAIAAVSGILDCVVLNACFTADDAEAFRGVTHAVAGSVTAVNDAAALAFTLGFYTGTIAGLTVENAYAAGCSQMKIEGHGTEGMRFADFAEGR